MNTPRSLEACRREGIQPNEIVKISFEDFQKKYKLSNLDQKGIEQFYSHFEEKREQKFKDLVKQRHLVIEDEKSGINCMLFQDSGLQMGSRRVKWSRSTQIKTRPA